LNKKFQNGQAERNRELEQKKYINKNYDDDDDDDDDQPSRKKPINLLIKYSNQRRIDK